MKMTVTEEQINALGDILLRQGHWDQRTLVTHAAVAGGMDVMFDAGIAAASAGETTIEEVTRSLRHDP
jgi:type II secretory ATPase GspE/PulE/Tfp pilus assembly ATPase PilB-like protein